jgi:Fic family protein
MSNIDEIIKKIDTLNEQQNQLQLTTNNLLRLVPHFRLDWGANENNNTEEYNIGVTKPILLSKLSDPNSKLNSENLFSNKIALLLVDTFLIKRKLTKALLLEIHSSIIKNGGYFRNQDVIVNDQTYAANTFFSNPNELEFQIEELINWYNKEANLDDIHPLILSTLFHYNFVKIHPFLDGNGRMARIISSLILLSNRLPPPSIKSEDRSSYIQGLRKADLGNLAPLTLFIGGKVVASLENVLSLNQKSDG